MNTNQIRSLTANFSNLQGLKGLPIGLYFIFLAGYNLGWFGSSNDRGLPMIVLALALVSFFPIRAAYGRRYGKVVPTRRYHVREILYVVVAVILIFLAMMLDSILTYTVGLTFSLQALAWGLFFLSFAWWLNRAHYVLYFLVFVALSFLPVLGLVEKAWLFDYVEGYIGWMVLGLTLIVGGVVDHLYIVGNLRAAGEVTDGASI